MLGYGVAFLVGLVCIGLGISNYRGNIETLHEYHRKRVKEEDRLPFGHKVGLGTILVGIGVCIYSALSGVTVWTGNDIFTIIGAVVMVIAMITGICISFAAMIKYNKGIF